MTTTRVRDPLGYYALLGVRPDATPDEIKAAYRRAARRWHPDLNPAPEAGERMAELNRAYEVLSDPDERAAYDRGETGPAAEPSDPGPPRPVVSPARVGFGRLRPGERATRTVTVSNAGGPCATVRVEPEFGPWFALAGARGGSSPDVVAHLEFEAFVDPSTGLPPGRHEASVAIHLDDRRAEVILEVDVVSAPTRRRPSTGADPWAAGVGRGAWVPPSAPPAPPPPSTAPPPPVPVAYVERHPVWARIGLALVAGLLVPSLLATQVPGHPASAIAVALLLTASTIWAAATTGFFTDPGRAGPALQWVAAAVLWLGRASLWAAAIAIVVYVVIIVLAIVLGLALAAAVLAAVFAALAGATKD